MMTTIISWLAIATVIACGLGDAIVLAPSFLQRALFFMVLIYASCILSSWVLYALHRYDREHKER